MEEKQMQTRAEAIGGIIGGIGGLFVVFLSVIIFDINPSKEYGWFAGGFHGAWLPAYWVMSWFSDSVLLKAPVHTSAYNVFWWMGVLFGCWGWIKTILSIIANARLLKK